MSAVDSPAAIAASTDFSMAAAPDSKGLSLLRRPYQPSSMAAERINDSGFLCRQCQELNRAPPEPSHDQFQHSVTQRDRDCLTTQQSNQKEHRRTCWS